MNNYLTECIHDNPHITWEKWWKIVVPYKQYTYTVSCTLERTSGKSLSQPFRAWSSWKICQMSLAWWTFLLRSFLRGLTQLFDAGFIVSWCIFHCLDGRCISSYADTSTQIYTYNDINAKKTNTLLTYDPTTKFHIVDILLSLSLTFQFFLSFSSRIHHTKSIFIYIFFSSNGTKQNTHTHTHTC